MSYTTIVLGIYLALLLGLAMFSGRLFRGTSKDYFVASHSIGPFLLLMSVFGTTMTAFALVGSTGKAFERGIGTYGLMASSSGLIHAACFFLIGVKIWCPGPFSENAHTLSKWPPSTTVYLGIESSHRLVGINDATSALSVGSLVADTTRTAFSIVSG